jgi:hypothetical protein
MRIRQVKPAFWTDPTIARASYPARLFYIGLWCVADDAGFLDWDIPQMGALLFPHESPKRREQHMDRWSVELVDLGRLELLECGCGVIPTLAQHQRITGKQSFAARDLHRDKHRPLTDKHEPLSDSPGRVGKGRVGNVTVGNGSARATDDENDEESDFRRLVPRPGATATGVH